MEFEATNDIECAKALIYVDDTDNVVMVRRSETAPKAAHLVEPAGGAWEPGESPYETVVREIKEELGIELTREEYVSASFNLTPRGKKSWIITFRISPEKAASIVKNYEASEIIIEPVGDYLKRTDAWDVFQWQVAYAIRKYDEVASK